MNITCMVGKLNVRRLPLHYSPRNPKMALIIIIYRTPNSFLAEHICFSSYTTYHVIDVEYDRCNHADGAHTQVLKCLSMRRMSYRIAT